MKALDFALVDPFTIGTHKAVVQIGADGALEFAVDPPSQAAIAFNNAGVNAGVVTNLLDSPETPELQVAYAYTPLLPQYPHGYRLHYGGDIDTPYQTGVQLMPGVMLGYVKGGGKLTLRMHRMLDAALTQMDAVPLAPKDVANVERLQKALQAGAPASDAPARKRPSPRAWIAMGIALATFAYGIWQWLRKPKTNA